MGNSGPPNQEIKTFADNDGWYDDVSDGPVNASVRIKGTNDWIQASSAWVICAPPKFAPQIEDMITLYDALLQAAIDKGVHGSTELLPSDPLSFTTDIYPLLDRAMKMKWVSAIAKVMHKPIKDSIPHPGPDTLEQQKARKSVFKRVRNPSTNPRITVTNQDMPFIWSDLYKFTGGGLPQGAALKKFQYYILEQWKIGNFNNDWQNNPINPETKITPEGLTQAALENCVGGGFFPGIETSYLTRDSYTFLEPFEFRLDATNLSAGDLTKQMAVPWQADFFDCAYEDPFLWWPAHRPDDVFPTLNKEQKSWIGEEDNINNVDDFVRNWHKLGFVIQQDDGYIESQRNSPRRNI